MGIRISGIGSDFRIPGAYAEILFGEGPASAALAGRQAVIVAPMLASGTSWTANQLYEVGNESEVSDGAGAGSMAHRMARVFLRVNKATRLFVLPYAPSSGGAPVAATTTITVSGSPTKGGWVVVRVCGEEFTVSFSTADTATTIAAKIVALINGRTHLPVTAANASGVVTLTAKIVGASQGDADVKVHRVSVDAQPGTGVTMATAGDVGSVVAGADGSTTEVANLTTALGTIDSVRKHYLLFSHASSGALSAAATHVSTKSAPSPGLRSFAVFGTRDTLSDTQALTVARNYERMSCAWQPVGTASSEELAANYGAVLAKYQSLDSAYNFDGFSGTDWLIPAADDVANWPDSNDINDALNDGITPIASRETGSYVVMAVTTRSKDSGGSVDDFRASEVHRVSVADEFVDEALATYALNYQGQKLAGDKLLPDGNPDPNQAVPRGVVTPSRFKPWIVTLVRSYDEERGLLQNFEASKVSLAVTKEPGGRLACGMDLHVIDLLHQATFRFAEVSEG